MSNPTELPDLDKIEEQVRRAYMADARFVAFLQPGTILDIIQLARRAQPEGEVPQAEHSRFGSPEMQARILSNLAPATLSPLCGAQHAESGKELTHCDPAEGFCKACREQDRAAQLDGGQEGSGSNG